MIPVVGVLVATLVIASGLVRSRRHVRTDTPQIPVLK
jgi:hypothetical protein